MEENNENQLTQISPGLDVKLTDLNEVEQTLDNMEEIQNNELEMIQNDADSGLNVSSEDISNSLNEDSIIESEDFGAQETQSIKEFETVATESEVFISENKEIAENQIVKELLAEPKDDIDQNMDAKIEELAAELQVKIDETTTLDNIEVANEAELSNIAEIPIIDEKNITEANTKKTEIIPEVAAPIKDELQHEVLDELENDISEHKIDYSSLNKSELLAILEKSAAAIKSESATNLDFKKADNQLKEIKLIFDQAKQADRKEAIAKFKAENDSDEGFEYKENEENIKFDSLYKKIKEAKHIHFSDQEKNKEKNFSLKTELLNQLRALADSEDGNINTVKSNIVTLRKLQQDWKDAGNVASPHNNTLWQTYHALVDRFYSNRSIYFELLELDRKKNLNLKVELCTKVEALAANLENEELTGKHLDEATHVFEEFKHVGPAAKDANELLWQRFKAALDTIYNKRRSQLEALKGTFEENLNAKMKVLESLALFTSFKSESINEWMEQTKAIDILQKQWDDIKGPLPKDKTREISKEFWNGVKQFYKNKSEFFKSLEAKREENLKLKESLCEQAEAFLATEEDSAENTKAVIKLQEDWRKIGHVPDKFRNKIYDRFKAACDGYFNKKRQKSNESEKEYQENLAKKIALCEKIEKEAGNGADIAQLPEIKKEWSAIGFVPKAEMQAIQKRYINAINNYVGGLGKLTDREKEKLSLQTEVEILKQKDKGNLSGKDLGRKETDIRSKIQNLENDLSTLKNNLEFFARSKNADKLKNEFEVKIKKGEEELAHMKHQLKVVRQAAD